MNKHTIHRLAMTLAAALSAPPLAAQDAYAPFGRDPADPASSFAMRDKAGSEMQHMVIPAAAPGRIEGERCMPRTSLCFSLNESDQLERPQLRVRVFGNMSADRSFPLDLELGEDTEISLWTLAIRRAPERGGGNAGEDMIVGVRTLDRKMYSGGSAHQTILWLYRIQMAGTDQATLRQVLSVPEEAGQSSRACFNKRDERQRHNACLDETSVSTMLVLDEDNSDPMPRLAYRVTTGSYPSDIPFRVTENPPRKLTRGDLVAYRHPVCSYDRKLAWNPATVRYEFDSPAPECRVFGLER